MASVSSYINHIIAVVGYRNLIIIGIIIVLLIIAIIIYRSLRLKVYRQEIVEIENHVNGIKSLPIFAKATPHLPRESNSLYFSDDSVVIMESSKSGTLLFSLT